MAIRIRTGLRADLPATAVLGQPLFCTDTGEFFVGTGTGVTPVSATAAWATIASGTNANHLTIGSGGILDHSGTGIIDANKLSGVTLVITSLTSGDVLRYNGTNWVNHALNFSDIAGSITAGQEPATTVNAITNDTNVHGSISAQTLTLSWSGLLGLARGGTDADLSATGGAHQVLRQSSSGAAVTVSQLDFTDLSGTASSVQLPADVAYLDVIQTFTAAQTFNDGKFKLAGSSSGALIIKTAAAASGILTLPAGTTDFSATGGTSQVVQQSSSGGAFTVGQLAFTDISGTATSGQLPADVVYNDTDNTFDTTHVQTFTAGTKFLLRDPSVTSKKAEFDVSNVSASTTRTVNIPDANSTTAQAKSSTTSQFLTSMSAQGVFSSAQPAFSDISGTIGPTQFGSSITLTESTAPSGAASDDILYADSTAHRLKMVNNNGTADVVVGAATVDVFTHKTFDTAGAGNVLEINGTGITDITGTGKVVLQTSPSLVTPAIGLGGYTVAGSSSGVQTYKAAATASGIITWPAGTVDFSATGGASQVVKQSSSGGIFTVGQLAFTDISGSITAGQEPNTTVNAVTNDTNVTGSISAQTLTLGWTGQLGLARGGTNVDLSASGGTTKILAQDASHVISARDLVAADIPNLSAAKITSGQLALAQGGTHADLSATGGTHFVLRQSSVGADITVSQLASSDLSDTANIALLSATNAFTGSNSFSKDLTFSGTITPTTLSGDVNDYNPSGFANAFMVRINPGAANRNITGLQASTDGRMVTLENVGTNNLLILKNQSTSSSSANRFQFVNDVVLQPGASASLIYDTTAGFWRHFSRPGLNNIFSLADNSEVRIGSITNIVGNTSRLYVFGGANGCNIDVQADGSAPASDVACIEIEGSDYASTVNSVSLRYWGPTGLGTTMGFTNHNLAVVESGGTTTSAMLIRGSGNYPLVFGTNDLERARITARGELQISNSIQVTGAGKFVQIASPSTPTVSPHNGSASTWAYKIVAYDNLDQPTAASSAGQTTTGAATLDSTHWNDVSWSEVPGALYYKVFRTTVATSPSTTGAIATVDSGTFPLSIRDNGLAGDSSTAPTVNTTSRVQTSGLVLLGSTSGSILVQASATASGTLTLPAATDTLVARATADTLTNKRVTLRVVALTDATSFTLDTDNADQCTQANTQTAGTLTANAPSGTPTDGQKIIFRIKSTNVQTYSWNAAFRGSTSVALPTASSGGGKTDYLGFIYNNADTKWDLVAYDAGH